MEVVVKRGIRVSEDLLELLATSHTLPLAASVRQVHNRLSNVKRHMAEAYDDQGLAASETLILHVLELGGNVTAVHRREYGTFRKLVLLGRLFFVLNFLSTAVFAFISRKPEHILDCNLAFIVFFLNSQVILMHALPLSNDIVKQVQNVGLTQLLELIFVVELSSDILVRAKHGKKF